MSEKNKQKNAPAVGSPAAGSNNKREKINIKKVWLIACVCLVFAVGVTAAFIFWSGSLTLPQSVRNAEFKGRFEPDSVAVETSLSLSQQEKLANAMNSKGNMGAFDFYVNEKILIEEHTDPALIEFGSVESNDCILVAFLLDENGEVIYRSLGVEPGKELRSVVLFDSVSYGAQTATLAVNGYDAETYEKIGTQTVKIDLKIGVDTLEK